MVRGSSPRAARSSSPNLLRLLLGPVARDPTRATPRTLRSLLLKSLGYDPPREIASEAPFCDCSGPSGVVLRSFQGRFTVAEGFCNRLLGACCKSLGFRGTWVRSAPTGPQRWQNGPPGSRNRPVAVLGVRCCTTRRQLSTPAGLFQRALSVFWEFRPPSPRTKPPVCALMGPANPDFLGIQSRQLAARSSDNIVFS